jgi:hypothetical protein
MEPKETPEEGPMADAPSNLGVRNPYPLANTILLKRKVTKKPVQWEELEADKVKNLLEEAFRIPYEHLFDPNPEFKSPLYNGVPEPGKESGGPPRMVLSMKRPPPLSMDQKMRLVRKVSLPPAEEKDDVKVGSGAIPDDCSNSVDDWIDNTDRDTWVYDPPAVGAPALGIKQGCTPDCYYIAALTSFAWTTNPLLLGGAADPAILGNRRYTFRNKPINSGSTRDTKSTPELLPVDSFQSLVFARPADGITVWSSLSEKAYAWFHGKDAARPDIGGLDFYNPVEALWEVTGSTVNSQNVVRWRTSTSPSLTFDLVNLFKDIKAKAAPTTAGKATKPMVAWTFFDSGELPFGTPTDSFDALIVANHAYSILGITKVDTADCIVLRNPWGYFRGTPKAGIFSCSPSYAPTGGLNPSDGNFAMTVDAFTHYFKGYAWKV